MIPGCRPSLEEIPHGMGILKLDEEGRYTTAYQIGVEKFGPLQDWPDQVLAGRVAHQVGAVRTGRYFHLRAGRRDSKDSRGLRSLAL